MDKMGFMFLFKHEQVKSELGLYAQQYLNNEDMEEVTNHKATQEDLAQTEVLLAIAEQSQSDNNFSEEKYKKLEERFTNMKSKARARIAEKDTEIQELTKKAAGDGQMIQTLTANCQDAVHKLNDKEKKIQEQEEALTKHNSLKAKYEYKINYLEEKVKKTPAVDVSQYETKIKALESELADLDTENSKEYEAKIKALEDKLKDSEQTATKTLMQQTNNIRKNYESKIADFEKKSKQSEESIKKLEDQLKAKNEKKKGVETEKLKKMEEKLQKVEESKAELKLVSDKATKENKEFSKNLEKLEKKFQKSRDSHESAEKLLSGCCCLF